MASWMYYVRAPCFLLIFHTYRKTHAMMVYPEQIIYRFLDALLQHGMAQHTLCCRSPDMTPASFIMTSEIQHSIFSVRFAMLSRSLFCLLTNCMGGCMH